VLKESAGAEIVQAIAALQSGKTFFSPAVAEVMLDDYLRSLTRRGITDRYEALSEREREVLQLVAEGRSTKEISELLSISVATVETHRAHILQKLDLKNTAGVVLFAARRGIIS
jgi:DNA-binding NarL/FixJ family response regulator